MDKKIVEYTLITFGDTYSLAVDVARMIEKWWQPLGWVCYMPSKHYMNPHNGCGFIQAMVKYE